MRAATPSAALRVVIAGALALLLTGLCHAASVLITGANSGIGLEFTKQYAAAGWEVIATHHRDKIPDTLVEVMHQYKNVRVEEMDVTNAAQVQALSERLAKVPIDLLINNAGVYDDKGDWSTQEFGHLDYDLFDKIMAVNVKGPLLVSEAFVRQVKASTQRKIVSISSSHASLTQPLAGTGAISYRASKAALNREMMVVAETLKPDRVTVVLIHPGAVRTEHQVGVNYPGQIETSVSVAQMIKTIQALTLNDSGRFLLYDGTTMPW